MDAAYAGVAAVCPEFRWVNEGVADCADSYCTNPHKWLLTNFDCDAFWVADRRPLLAALSILPDYLRNTATEAGQVIDYRDWQIPLGRRFRALKLWSVIRCYGAEGLRAHIRAHVQSAAEFAAWVRGDERFEIAALHPLALVCFRMRLADLAPLEQDAANMALMEQLNGSVSFSSPTPGSATGSHSGSPSAALSRSEDTSNRHGNPSAGPRTASGLPDPPCRAA